AARLGAVVAATGHPHRAAPPLPGDRQLPHRLPALGLVAAQATPGGRRPPPAGGLGSDPPRGRDPGGRRRRPAGTGRPPGAPASAAGAHRATTSATARQAMPSARPRAPRPSARLPLTVTG